jgi:hypothetical protein
MADHTDPTPTTGAPTTTTEVLAAITAEEPHGATADQVARTIGLSLDGTAVQDVLEEVVARGLLDRRGRGLGTVSGSAPSIPSARWPNAPHGRWRRCASLLSGACSGAEGDRDTVRRGPASTRPSRERARGAVTP